MRYVIALDTTLRLLEDRPALAPGTQLVAPTLLRSELVAALYAEESAGRIDRKEANARLDRFRALKPRLLGDRVLQSVSWDIARKLGHSDTLKAEYLALTRLQADAFVTLDAPYAATVAEIVPLAPFEALTA